MSEYDKMLAIQLQKEEMEMHEQLFMMEMMEQRDEFLRSSGQDEIDPDKMTYEVAANSSSNFSSFKRRSEK